MCQPVSVRCRQPFTIETPEGDITWQLNSEIYNHEDVQQQYLSGVNMVRNSKSDSAKPGHLYEKYGDDDKIWNALDGTFACVIWDERTQQFCAARDPIGICPMYWGKDKDGATWFASEMKALQHQCVSFEIFPPVRLLHSHTMLCMKQVCSGIAWHKWYSRMCHWPSQDLLASARQKLYIMVACFCWRSLDTIWHHRIVM